MPIALYALTVGAFGIGVTEFVIMGLLLQVSADLGVTIPVAGLLMSGYALGVFVGAPILTIATRSLPRKTTLLVLMAIFTLGNLAAALAPSFAWLMGARIVTALAHGTFFGVGSVVAARVSEATTPRVPLASSPQAASRPGWETETPSTSVCGPVATKGTSSAKSTNGVSTTIRRAM